MQLDVKRCRACGSWNQSSFQICQKCGAPFEAADRAEAGPESPWDWRTLVLVAFLGGFVASAIVAGINWRRMGRPHLMWPTIGIAIAAVVGLYPSVAVYMIHWAYMLATVAVTGILWYWQRGAYRAWKDSHRNAQQAGALIPVLSIIVGNIVLYGVWRIVW